MNPRPKETTPDMSPFRTTRININPWIIIIIDYNMVIIIRKKIIIIQ